MKFNLNLADILAIASIASTIFGVGASIVKKIAWLEINSVLKEYAKKKEVDQEVNRLKDITDLQYDHKDELLTQQHNMILEKIDEIKQSNLGLKKEIREDIARLVTNVKSEFSDELNKIRKEIRSVEL